MRDRFREPTCTRSKGLVSQPLARSHARLALSLSIEDAHRTHTVSVRQRDALPCVDCCVSLCRVQCISRLKWVESRASEAVTVEWP